jgi:hypothetical protein
VPQCFHTRNLPTESDPCKHSFDAAFLHGSVLTVEGLTAAGANATFTRGCLPLSTTRGCNPAGSLCCADGAPKAPQAYEVQLFTSERAAGRACFPIVRARGASSSGYAAPAPASSGGVSPTDRQPQACWPAP